MIYTEQNLESINDIQIGTYHKDPKNFNIGPPMCCVYIQNKDNIGSGTVYSKLGDYDTYAENSATEILGIINYGRSCYVAGTPS